MAPPPGEGDDEGDVDSGLHPFVDQVRRQASRKGAANYQGLTPEQMYRLIYYPFDSPELVTFPSCMENPPEALMLTIFMLLARAISSAGVKPTATGNLPRTLCQEVAQGYLSDAEYRKLTELWDVRTELELGELHKTRIVAEMAGLIRKHKGRFIVGRECRKLIAEKGPAAIYPRLFQSYARHYNWGYGDTWAGTPMIQQSFLYSLFLLKKNGVKWQSNVFYEDAFLRAFPRAVREVRPQGGSSPEQVLRACYSRRCLNGFARLLGLVEIAPVEWHYSESRLRKLPLLDDAVHFSLLPAGG